MGWVYIHTSKITHTSPSYADLNVEFILDGSGTPGGTPPRACLNNKYVDASYSIRVIVQSMIGMLLLSKGNRWKNDSFMDECLG